MNWAVAIEHIAQSFARLIHDHRMGFHFGQKCASAVLPERDTHDHPLHRHFAVGIWILSPQFSWPADRNSKPSGEKAKAHRKSNTHIKHAKSVKRKSMFGFFKKKDPVVTEAAKEAAMVDTPADLHWKGIVVKVPQQLIRKPVLA